MRLERMEELVGLLPSDAPCLVRIPRSLNAQGFPAEVSIRAHALNDPGFGWMFIKSFLDLGRPLPVLVYESQLLRPYCYLRYGNYDPDARAAIELEQLRNWQRRALLRCMLLRDEYDYGSIAKRVNLSGDATRIYETLYWNVRDRDPVYIASLVYPDTRLVEFVPGYPLNEDPMNLALRLALDYGMESVDEFMGLKNPVKDLKGAEHARAFAARILSAGNFVAKIGGIHQSLPTLTNARRTLRSFRGGKGKESSQPGLDADDIRGLGGMGRGRSLREAFLELMKPDLERQIALQNSPSSGNGKSSSELTSR